MPPTKLHISENLALPLDAVTETFAVMGIRGSGKTHTASVMAEEMLKAGQPIIVYDPTGAWFGLKTSADGKQPGFPVVIFGGEHPDVPLEETAGEMVAKVIVEQRFSAILDASLMRKGARVRFMQDFCETLYHKNREALHFFVDEAHTIAPQRAMPETARVLGAMEDIVLQGRRRGLGLTVISQRPALVHTNLRTQCSTLIAMRIVGPHDRKAIEEWTEAHGTPERTKEMLATLATLGKGEGWLWSVWLDLFKRLRFRQRETFDSSATPEVGKKTIVPKVVAAIDLAKLGEDIQATVQRTKEADPRELRKRIAELERQLRERPKETEERIVERIVEVPVLKNGQLDRALRLRDGLQELVGPLVEAIAKATNTTPPKVIPQKPQTITKSPAIIPQKPQTITKSPAIIPKSPAIIPAPGEVSLGRCERAILTALAQYPQGRSMIQVAVLSGYSVTSGGFKNSLGKLRSAGFVNRDHPIRVTDAGLAALGDWTPLPTGKQLQAYWLRDLPKCEGAILDALLKVHPDALTMEDLAQRTGYSPTSGGFKNALGRLRTLELISRGQPIRAADEFFQ